jgi:hypothetical protein
MCVGDFKIQMVDASLLGTSLQEYLIASWIKENR